VLATPKSEIDLRCTVRTDTWTGRDLHVDCNSGFVFRVLADDHDFTVENHLRDELLQGAAARFRQDFSTPSVATVEHTYQTLTDGEVDTAIQQAQQAFADWRQTSIEERAAKVERLVELFEANVEELAAIMTKEMGKPITEAREETEFCAEIFHYYATHGAKFAADQQVNEDDETVSLIQRRPVGPLLGIMPWDFLYYQIARFASPNLMLRNTILLKHAESCPESALAMQWMMDEAGIPAGVHQNMFATHEQISQIIVHPGIQGVSLTGSERAGAAIAEQAGKHLKKAVLELGGSDPYVILFSDDVKAAAAHALAVRLENTGQACN